MKYYLVGYKKFIGGEGIITVKGVTESDAINQAKKERFTGSDFKIIKSIPIQVQNTSKNRRTLKRKK
jgi:hypothetical protein